MYIIVPILKKNKGKFNFWLWRCIWRLDASAGIFIMNVLFLSLIIIKLPIRIMNLSSSKCVASNGPELNIQGTFIYRGIPVKAYTNNLVFC